MLLPVYYTASSNCKIFFVITAILLSSSAQTHDLPAVEKEKLQADLIKLISGETDFLKTYPRLKAQYERLRPGAKAELGQIISQADALAGRYEDAATDFQTSFPDMDQPVACPSQGMIKVPVRTAVAQPLTSSQIILLNESHSIIRTRAEIINMLPYFRKAGYSRLGLEALTETGHSPQGLDNLQKLGYPLTGGKLGVYLQEPLYAELVREAIRLRFTLFAYDPVDSANRADREHKQAAAILDQLGSHKGQKTLIVAGYSHIWKTDGWMADLVSRSLNYHVTSVDFVEGTAGCIGRSGAGAPYLLQSRSGRYWSAHPDRVDMTVLGQGSNIRASQNTWLYLWGRRRRVSLPRYRCSAVPCIVEARYKREHGNAVPADRFVVLRNRENVILYLLPGAYEVRFDTSKHTNRYYLYVK